MKELWNNPVQVGKYTVMVDEFEKVALDCLSNSFLRKAGLVVIDEVEKPSMLNADPLHGHSSQSSAWSSCLLLSDWASP